MTRQTQALRRQAFIREITGIVLRVLNALGLGADTSVASLAMKSNGSKSTCVVPFPLA